MSVSNTDYLSRTNSERVSVGGVASLKESLHRLWPLPLPSRIPEAVRIPTAQKMAIRSPKGQNGQTRRETKTRRNGKRLFVALEIRCGQIDDLRRRQKRGEIEATDRPSLPFLFLAPSSFGIAPSSLFIKLTDQERRMGSWGRTGREEKCNYARRAPADLRRTSFTRCAIINLDLSPAPSQGRKCALTYGSECVFPRPDAF